MCTLEQGHMKVMENADDVTNNDSDDDHDFTDDDDGFLMMTPIVTEISRHICCNKGFFYAFNA
jgi:hypothetical protein